jgi:predicted RNA-binding Zn-ribbon protein involved in translation (DUF1610 family)
MVVQCSGCNKHLVKDIWVHLKNQDHDKLFSYCPTCLDSLLKEVKECRNQSENQISAA